MLDQTRKKSVKYNVKASQVYENKYTDYKAKYILRKLTIIKFLQISSIRIKDRIKSNS